MAETVLEQILDDLRGQAVKHYPQRGDFKNLRVVGHTPKIDHFIYDVCIDCAAGSERVAIKIYRPGKTGTMCAERHVFGYRVCTAAKSGFSRLRGTLRAPGTTSRSRTGGKD